jgi:hypothetical protein
MKTRIKIVESKGGIKTYYIQYKEWFFWHSLLTDWGSRASYCDLVSAKEGIDFFLQKEKQRNDKKTKSVTYVKYP